MEFICFDTEDDSRELLASGKSGFDKRVTQISARCSDGTRFHNRGDVAEFLSWVMKRKEKTLYALNIQYDLGNLFGKCLDELDAVMVGGRMIKATWKGKVFADVFNIWPMSVKALGEQFGLKKGELDEHSKEYVDRDVDIIFEAMSFANEFTENIGLKSIPSTLGGLCVKVWKHFGGCNVHDSHELSKAAYYGGRVELFKHQSETDSVSYVDINSLYPTVMLGKFPGLLEDRGNSLAPYGVADVTIELPETDLGLLPWRNSEGRIFYGWGRIRGVWTMPEINNAVEHGAKVKTVHQCLGSDDGYNCYSEFVENMYEARKMAETDAESLFFKLLMNNLYGRLGTGGEIGRTVYRTEKNEGEGVPFGEKVLVNYKMPLAEETNWCHAAYVTAYGRLELQRFIRLIGVDRMIYADTDSCIFDNPEKVLPFETGKELGQMKIEACCLGCGDAWGRKHEEKCQRAERSDYWPHCVTYAPKLYNVGGIHKAKGVPKTLAKEFIETGKASFDLPFKYREAVRFYDRKNARRLSVWRAVEKQIRSDYDRKKLVDNRFFPRKLTGMD